MQNDISYITILPASELSHFVPGQMEYLRLDLKTEAVGKALKMTRMEFNILGIAEESLIESGSPLRRTFRRCPLITPMIRRTIQLT